MDHISAVLLKNAKFTRLPDVHYAVVLAVMLLGLLASTASPSPPDVVEKSAEDLAKLRTTFDIKTVHRGQKFNLVLIFDIQPKWHIYWKNPGEGSPPPDVVVEVPDGFKVGKIRWPRPIEMESPLGVEYVYEKQAALFVPITAPKNLSDGEISIKADVRWAVCKHICLWGSSVQTLKLSTSSKSRDPKSQEVQVDPEIRKLSKRLPKPIKNAKDIDSASASFDGSNLTITGPAHGLSKVNFFPGLMPGISCSSQQAIIQDDRFTINVDIEINRRNTLGKPIVLQGLVVLGSKLDDPSYEFQVPVDKRTR